MPLRVLPLCRWLTACVEGLPASPYGVRESFRSGRHSLDKLSQSRIPAAVRAVPNAAGSRGAEL
ncbi:hypothetical protein HaLaN_25239 [Haematococcus lacustris]|uniref:Uncharacterized protein n=1 Tax=Haematococcus lacustris TaxID=44745 RepID=A0A6A0A504_HAELA|nr:hypothetical protein HaLaN_25239 [Haematococcus lacustris]